MSCRSAPTTTRTPGEPARPWAARSHPARRSTSSRAAVRQVKFAIVPPVTNPTALSAGRPSRSSSQADATSSTAVCAGVTVRRPEFWSHALTSQSAASAAGCEPPMTKPKNRPDGMAVSPGSAARASSATTSGAGVGPSGSSVPSAATTWSADARGGTGRVGSDASHAVACWCATARAGVMSSMAGSSSPRRGSDQGRAGASGAVPVFSASAWGCSGCSASAR